MIGRDIKDGDIVIVDIDIQPVNGDIVVAEVNNESTIKT
jgi:SOS-response transcriptional repressor LexA